MNVWDFIVGREYRIVRLGAWYWDARMVGHRFICSSIDGDWAYEVRSPFGKRYHRSCCEPVGRMKREPAHTETLL